MYHRFFGLEHDPFRLTPSAEMVFAHPSFKRARAYLEYGLMRGEGFVVVTGPPGCGKTTLVADLLASVPEETDIAQIVTSRLGAEDLLRLTASGFGLAPAHRDKATILATLQQDLTARAHRGRRALLVVDEAQDLEAEALEELRLLTNLTVNGEPALQILLLGQPPLRELIRRPEMEQFHQRLIASCRLEPLDEQQTRDYVHYRLERAGWDGDPSFSEAVFRLLHVATGGVPRRINLLAGRMLLDAFADSRHTIRAEHLRAVLDEMEDEALDEEWRVAYDAIAGTEADTTTTPDRTEPTGSPGEDIRITDTDAPVEDGASTEPLLGAWNEEPHTLRPLGTAKADQGPTPPGQEPILTDIVSPEPRSAGAAATRTATGTVPPRQRHTTAWLAGLLAVVALVIVLGAATPVFDGLHTLVADWYARLLGGG
ncbi:ExeA family protein [Arhodomonas aquaeolei]|uniref:ExeA family protein n=1 Tax=Arhodomonas aquaeolei TaxID=2369 RepID=UPI00036DB04E|nr:AAA family ATPase [Arhodomonas aquaeolei]